jgi:hypothetical protein
VKEETYGHKNEGRFRTSSAAVTVICGYSKAAFTNSSFCPMLASQSRLHTNPSRGLKERTKIWPEKHIAVELRYQVLDQREDLYLRTIWPSYPVLTNGIC